MNVGLAGPLVSAVGQDLQVTGPISTTTGPATVVPAGATGVILNVTVVAPTANGFLSVRPADAPGLPTTSSLNFSANEVTPNAVTVQLPTAGADAGKIEITYDAYGVAGPSTDVLVDVVGYTTDAKLAALEARLAALEATTAGLHNSVSAYAGGDQYVGLTTTGAVVRTVNLMPPANGKVIVNSSGYVSVPDTAGAIDSLFHHAGHDVGFGEYPIRQHSPYDDTPSFDDPVQASDVIAGTRGYDVVQGVPFTVNLVCDVFAGNAKVSDTWLSAIFVPN